MATKEVLGRDKSTVSPLRQAHLYRRAAEMLDLSGAGDVPAGGGDEAPVVQLNMWGGT